MPDLITKYLGLTLRNPIIISSSGLTKDIARLKRCADSGAGAAVMKSLFEAEVARRDPSPCYRLIERGGNTVFYSYEQASEWGPERYADEFKRASNEIDIPIIPSINCATLDGWRDYSKILRDAGAQALELNVSCPYGSISSEDEDPETVILKSVEAVHQSVSIPVAVKLPGRLTSPLKIITELESMGVAGIVMFNRFAGLDIDIDDETPIMHGGSAGHGGAFSLHYPLLWISRASTVTKMDIAASGGVASAEDVIKYLLAGADAVQVCTAAYLRGYKIIGKLLAGLVYWMDAKGHSNIEAFRGKVSGNKIADMHTVDRAKKAIYEIDIGSCSLCDICRRRCLHDAIIVEDGLYSIVRAKCTSCGFCFEICPSNAVKIISD
jgi:dihydroorotate dehydrogenase (fumarate)